MDSAAPRPQRELENGAQRRVDDAILAQERPEVEPPILFDRRRLAKIFFGIAATLDAGKSSVELLQEQALRADPALAGMRDLFELRFEQYAEKETSHD